MSRVALKSLDTAVRRAETDSDIRWDIFKIQPGWVGVMASTEGICRLTLPQPGQAEALGQLKPPPGATRTDNLVSSLATKLESYFKGISTDFPFSLDLGGYTPFESLVFQACAQIPYGQTASYGQIARQIGYPKAARAVGQALHKNPVPLIVPCHRIIAGSGKTGGFNGGINIKCWLLTLEARKPSGL
ncbi:cysteine methyltransferase [Dehalococcoides mccartyi]|uniref:methylated-DNA--[protein]-cysteine S-methyltransferase n=4 Tax=Dehalococcoides mccartyi TaxID=61435 RepID=A0A328ER45_9CHLR|nr:MULTISPECIES: methylated-DNA--[protein]-cysteine S-methyltransferase [Dehalococcoides]AGG06910.1 methylated-DNA--protein-cysteine methyltransferase [Dehalococcoides mccartyi DCMB5]AQU06432.1 cysteine methyltransferase [Dehalococcoides mccartyi]AQU07874.1 cysteine methyltransferase [Dehalococcoides mccartyi]AQX75115.1 cysteine methyltransferase [Dehalococcoides mccartyi]AQY73691.1 cysteine methyltransferase [Dehalococcoides mccartyi]